MLYDVPCFFQGGISTGGNPSHPRYPGLFFHLPRWGTRNAKQHDGVRGHAWGPLPMPDPGGPRFLSLTQPKSFNQSPLITTRNQSYSSALFLLDGHIWNWLNISAKLDINAMIQSLWNWMSTLLPIGKLPLIYIWKKVAQCQFAFAFLRCLL